jgi:hypothetical protein
MFCSCVVGDLLRLIYFDLHFEKLILFVVFFWSDLRFLLMSVKKKSGSFERFGRKV